MMDNQLELVRDGNAQQISVCDADALHCYSYGPLECSIRIRYRPLCRRDWIELSAITYLLHTLSISSYFHSGTYRVNNSTCENTCVNFEHNELRNPTYGKPRLNIHFRLIDIQYLADICQTSMTCTNSLENLTCK